MGEKIVMILVMVLCVTLVVAMCWLDIKYGNHDPNQCHQPYIGYGYGFRLDKPQFGFGLVYMP